MGLCSRGYTTLEVLWYTSFDNDSGIKRIKCEYFNVNAHKITL